MTYNGNLCVADIGNNLIRRISSNGGTATTLAGTGTSGSNSGAATSATFNYPMGIADNSAGTTVYVADTSNGMIRQITGGYVTTLAGMFGAGFLDGTGSGAIFNYPEGLALDASGNVLVADNSNGRLRQVTTVGVVTTLVSGMSSDAAVVLDDAGNYYLTMAANNIIVRYTKAPAVVRNFLAGWSSGYADGTGTGASFYQPYGIVFDGTDTLYIADTHNNEIRQIK